MSSTLAANTLTGGQLHYVLNQTQAPEPKWCFGLDLGQRKDHSAIAATELLWTPRGRCPVTFAFLFEPRLHIRLLKRFPKGLSYDRVYSLVDSCISIPAPAWRGAKRQLVIDASGPGAPIVDRLRRNLDRDLVLKPMLITGGKIARNLKGGYTSVPRRELISVIQLMMAAGTLKCAREVEGYQTLKDELLELGALDTQPVSSRAHDDLAIAVGLAVWAITRDVPELLPEPVDSRRHDAPRSLYGPGPLF